MKIFWSLAIGCGLFASVGIAGEKLKFISPDGKYGVTMETVDGFEGEKEMAVTLVAVKSGEVLQELESVGLPWTKSVKIVWAPDSQRMAYVKASRRGNWTRFYARVDGKFVELPFPEMPKLEVAGEADSKTTLASYTAVRWTSANVLLVDNEVENTGGGSGRMRVALRFDARNEITATKVKK